MTIRRKRQAVMTCNSFFLFVSFRESENKNPLHCHCFQKQTEGIGDFRWLDWCTGGGGGGVKLEYAQPPAAVELVVQWSDWGHIWGQLICKSNEAPEIESYGARLQVSAPVDTPATRLQHACNTPATRLLLRGGGRKQSGLVLIYGAGFAAWCSSGSSGTCNFNAPPSTLRGFSFRTREQLGRLAVHCPQLRTLESVQRQKQVTGHVSLKLHAHSILSLRVLWLQVWSGSLFLFIHTFPSYYTPLTQNHISHRTSVCLYSVMVWLPCGCRARPLTN